MEEDFRRRVSLKIIKDSQIGFIIRQTKISELNKKRVTRLNEDIFKF